MLEILIRFTHSVLYIGISMYIFYNENYECKLSGKFKPGYYRALCTVAHR